MGELADFRLVGDMDNGRRLQGIAFLVDNRRKPTLYRGQQGKIRGGAYYFGGSATHVNC
jgi:hypothetical protein